MHFYQFHVGDYMSHTRHLTPMEDLAYRRMLDHAYTCEGGLPGDAAAVARLIGLRGHEAEVASVLSDFWTLHDGVWRNKRVDAEVARFRARSEKAAASAAVRWAAPMRTHSDRSANAVRSDCEGNATSNHEPRTINHEPIAEAAPADAAGAAVVGSESGVATTTPATPRSRSSGAARALPVPKPDDVADAVWQDWLAHRKAKRASVTQRVLDDTRKKAEAAGMTMDEALTHWVAQGYAGFFPPANGGTGSSGGVPAHGFDRNGKWQGVPRVIPKDYYKTGPVDENGWPLSMNP